MFSQGCLVLPHIHNRLSGQTTCALMCIRAWSGLGLVKDADIRGALADEINGPEEECPASWDAIQASHLL